jgi:hypothetical protein
VSKADIIVQSQLAMAQAIFAMAEHLQNSTGMQLTPVVFDEVPDAALGQLATISDSTTNTPGAVVAGGGAFSVLAWYNGTAWKVVAA